MKTTRYTKFSFFPVSLMNQFRRVANIYFLGIAILQSIKILSPLSPFTAILPLVAVLGLSMLREGWEDYQRYKADKETNGQLFNRIHEDSTSQDIRSDAIAVGDILIVKDE